MFPRGRYLVALGRSWHPEEFTCSQCKAVLEEGGFFEERGSVYCTKCHDNRYAPNCAKCKKKITGEIMHALKMTYHVQCFKCAACKNPIRNQAFYMEEGEPYCERGERLDNTRYTPQFQFISLLNEKREVNTDACYTSQISVSKEI
ncbi:PDZ and LIM domain protein 7 [Xenoophorus captivus]|uniref:PDZ and LIM domain protein 7 n=1 Tax=Xenoophorus captivus TaxID=1517983 RepID=A0ABV0QGW6_9TELE